MCTTFPFSVSSTASTTLSICVTPVHDQPNFVPNAELTTEYDVFEKNLTRTFVHIMQAACGGLVSLSRKLGLGAKITAHGKQWSPSMLSSCSSGTFLSPWGTQPHTTSSLSKALPRVTSVLIAAWLRFFTVHVFMSHRSAASRWSSSSNLPSEQVTHYTLPQQDIEPQLDRVS